MRQVGCEQPRVGVCALNPHAGEGGLFGDEEQRIIAPTLRRVREVDQINAQGPLPADTLIARAVAGEFDGVVAMYHDQGHIAIKLIAFHSAVNVTLGLPIIRTSPTQGTAFDIAWRGVARPDGMISAMLVAAQLAVNRRKGPT
jgi:4-hydroxythreonine-4-phosphate dehydrogenase